MNAFTESVSGYVQCQSHVFRVKHHNVILLKLTQRKNCFCRPFNHLLIRWNNATETDEEKLARTVFVRQCSVGCSVQVDGLKKNVIYKGQRDLGSFYLILSFQHRERPVLLFSPHNSKVVNLPEFEPCHPVKCPSWPVCLIRHLTCQIVRVNSNGTLLQVSATKPGAPVSSYLCVYAVGSRSRSLLPGRSLSLHNVWGVPIPKERCPLITSPQDNKFLRLCEGVIIVGMYSTCFVSSSVGVLRPIENQLPYTEETLSMPPLLAKSSIDVPRLIGDFTAALINENRGQLESTSTTSTEPGSLHLDRLLASIKQSEHVPQYAEEFITFPRLLPQPTLPNTAPYEHKNWITLTELAAISQVVKSSPVFNSSTARMHLPDGHSQLISTTTTHSYVSNCLVWHSRLVNIRLMTDHVLDAANNTWVAESLNAAPQPQANLPNNCALVGRLWWDSSESCFQLTQPHTSALGVLSPCFNEIDGSSVISIPVVFPRVYHALPVHSPLPSDQTMVALLDWRLTSESVSSRDPTRPSMSKQFIVATGCIALELDVELEESTASSGLPPLTRRTVKIASLGLPLRSSGPDIRDTVCYPLQYRLPNEDTDKSMLLSGPVALRWYSTLRMGAFYQLCSEGLNESEQRLLSIVLENTEESLLPTCEHLISPSQVCDVIRNTQTTLGSICKTIVLRGTVVHKFQAVGGWCLWLMDNTVSDNTPDEFTPDAVIQLYLPFEEIWIHALCTLWPFVCIRVYGVHIFQTTETSGDAFRLIASSLSRVEVEKRTGTFPCSNASSSPTVAPQQQSCSQCIRTFRSTSVLNTLLPLTWLTCILHDENNPTDGTVRIRGNIVGAWKFVCRRTVEEATSSDPISKCLKPVTPSFSISLCFLVSDGSASAVVSLGQKHHGRSTAESNELARVLFGLPQTTWTRLCAQLQDTIERDETAPNTTRGGYIYVKLSQENRFPTQLSPLEFALHTYLSSPSFIRPHIFHLRCTSPRNTTCSWRLKEVHLTGTSAISGAARSEKVHFVLPPFPTFTLVGLEPY
ncbi:hypothetical protein T265_07342 [Opisthorchis viverrini]|uniref:Uncharacterized protein n=1 Tax=Opisthorchis viverrini TaxID=6198 RepID=A0A074ZCW4_OPIVI|nr:hypothetical protein T265_07342 [Opisthorchis viverrini]KER25116.1 hypothetical protein T265_07342 [Opisthorchis viverrini]